MTVKDDPSVVVYRQEEFEKSVVRIETKLDRVIDNYATKVELAEAVSDRNDKIKDLKDHIDGKFTVLDKQLQKKTTTNIIASIISVISLITAAIALWELFR